MEGSQKHRVFPIVPHQRRVRASLLLLALRVADRQLLFGSVLAGDQIGDVSVQHSVAGAVLSEASGREVLQDMQDEVRGE